MTGLVEMAQSYPMIRGGGLFILIMGIGVILGGIIQRQRKLLLALGGAAATIAITLCAGPLSRSLGPPTFLQVAALVGAIALEGLLIAVVVYRYRRDSERRFYLAILFVVGIHFLPMVLSFGPLCAALGIAAMLNAGYGLFVNRGVPLRTLWISDGAIKVAFGTLMLSIPA